MLLVLQLPLVELLLYEASDLLTGRRFALYTFDPKPIPELLINNWLQVLPMPLTSCRIWRNVILSYTTISFT